MSYERVRTTEDDIHASHASYASHAHDARDAAHPCNLELPELCMFGYDQLRRRKRTETYFSVSILTIFLLFMGCIIRWGCVFQEYRIAVKGCNHEVRAFIVDQRLSGMFSKCDLDLVWKDAQGEEHVSVLRWDCDPSYEKEKREEPTLLLAFTHPMCYKEGESDPRLMGDGNDDDLSLYEMYDERLEDFRFRREVPFGQKLYSMSEIHRLKITWVILLIAWTVSLTTFFGVFSYACYYL